MHRIILAAVMAAAVALALSGATLAGGQDAPAATSAGWPTTPAQAWPARRVVTVKRYMKAVRTIYRHSHADGNFTARTGIGDKQHRKLQGLRKYARHRPARKTMLRLQEKWKRGWRHDRRLDRMTPYGKWAIEPYIVMCESGGSWSAANPSGAVGPYQLLGKGAPMPADTVSEWATHHIIAAGLWAGGSGRSHWAQCL